MSGSRVVAVRMSFEQYMIYEWRAIVAGMKPATYLKKILDERENSHPAVLSELREMQQKLESMQDLINELQDIISNSSQLNNDSDGYSQKGYVASIQTLLLLRAMAKPAHIDLVNNKLAELKLPTLS